MRWRSGAFFAGAIFLAPVTASAQVDGTWTGLLGNQWTTGGNWSSSPTVPDGTATFTTNGAPTSVNISSTASVSALTFDSGAPAFSFNIASGATFTIGTSFNNSSNFNPTFNVSSGATLSFGDGFFTTVGALTGGGTVIIGPTDSSTTLAIDSNTAMSFSGAFSGAGSLELDNDTNLTLTGRTNYGTIGGDLTLCSCETKGLTINGGLLTVNGAGEGVTIESGTLSVINGGRLQDNQDLLIAGRMVISGAGSSVTVNGDTGVGIFDAGSLTISNGGKLISQGEAEIDNFPGRASASVDGAGSSWTVNGTRLDVGGGSSDGPGLLSITNGGTVTVTTGELRVGDLGDGSSLVSVGGAGSTLTVGGVTRVGTSTRQGTLSVFDGGVVNANGGIIIATGNTVNLGTGGLAGSLVTPTITNNGSLVANFTDALTLSADISGTGTLSKLGAGTLTLTGTDTISGGTTVSGGRLAVNGGLTSDVTVNSGGNLGGSGTVTGTVTNNGTLSPGNSIGTLTVSGSYVQGAGSAYQVELNGAGQSDRINVTGAPGTATINGGTVQIASTPGSYAQSTTYTILNATGGVTGTFANVTSDFAFLTPTLSYNTNNVFLTLARSSNAFAAGAQTPNQRAVGAALDGGAPGATGDFATVINALTGLNTVQGPQALAALSGQPYANLGTISVQAGNAFMNAISNQVGVTHGQTTGGTRVALAEACDVGACEIAPSAYGAWISGVGGTGSAPGNSNASGYTYSFGGTAVGADYRFDPRFLAGVGLGFTTGTLWTSSFGGQGTADTFSGSLYGSFTEGSLYVDGLVGYANTNNRMSRSIVIPNLNLRLAQGQTQANQFLGQLETGYRFDLSSPAATSITPFVRLQGSTTNQAGFTESGAASIDLNVAAQTTNSLRTTLGADFAAELAKVNFGVRLGWTHEHADTGRPMTASFAGAPANAFTVYGVTPQRDSATVGLSADARIAETIRLYARYDGEVGGGSDNHAFSAGVRMVW